jgi:fumarate hydratase class I
MMNPSDSIVDWVIEMLPQMGAGWCPRHAGHRHRRHGGALRAAAKKALMEQIDMAQLKERGPQNDLEALRIEIFDKVNALGIGAQGLGGLATILDVKIMDAPCHAAGKPVAMIPNCAATRHAHFTLDGSGPSSSKRPSWRNGPGPLGAQRRGQEGQPRHADRRRGAGLEAGRPPAAQRQDADRPRCRPQAHRRHAGQG